MLCAKRNNLVFPLNFYEEKMADVIEVADTYQEPVALCFMEARGVGRECVQQLVETLQAVQYMEEVGGKRPRLRPVTSQDSWERFIRVLSTATWVGSPVIMFGFQCPGYVYGQSADAQTAYYPECSLVSSLDDPRMVRSNNKILVSGVAYMDRQLSRVGILGQPIALLADVDILNIAAIRASLGNDEQIGSVLESFRLALAAANQVWWGIDETVSLSATTGDQVPSGIESTLTWLESIRSGEDEKLVTLATELIELHTRLETDQLAGSFTDAQRVVYDVYKTLLKLREEIIKSALLGRNIPESVARRTAGEKAQNDKMIVMEDAIRRAMVYAITGRELAKNSMAVWVHSGGKYPTIARLAGLLAPNLPIIFLDPDKISCALYDE